MRRRGPTGGVTALAAAGAVGAAAAAAALTVGIGAAAGGTSTTRDSFLAVTDHGLSTVLELRSASTGRVQRRLHTFGENFTNNGLALSRDGRQVYFTLIGKRSLLLERLDVAGGQRTFIADGQQPAVSPDGRLLAYTAERASGRARILAVRDLATGATRTIDLRRLVGRPGDLLNAAVAWLGDGSDVAVVPGEMMIRISGRPARRGRQAPSATPGTRRTPPTPLIVVSVGAAGLTARSVAVPGLDEPRPTLGTDAADPQSVLVATSGAHDRTTVRRVTLSGATATVSPLVSIPSSLPMAFDSTGTRLLYLQGHSPPGLWVGTLAGTRLIHRHRLIADSELGAAAW